MKKRLLKLTALVMVFLVFSLIIPQASFFGLSLGAGKAEAQQLDESCGPSSSGVCKQISSTINKNGYFTRDYCPGSAALDIQCKIADSSIEDCSACTINSNLKWCWKDSAGYCAKKSDSVHPDQSCMSEFNTAASQSACSSVPTSAGGTKIITATSGGQSAECTAMGGICKDESACTNGMTWPGLCPVNNWKCCVPSEGTTPAGTGDISLVTPNLVANQQGTLEFRVPTNLNIASFSLSVYHQQTGTTTMLSPPTIFTNVCPPSCKITLTLQRDGAYNYDIKARNAQNQVVASGAEQFTVAATGTQQQGTGDVRTCVECQAAGRKWCVSHNEYGYPNAQCAQGTSDCPTSTTSVTTTYTNNCPSAAGLCEAACSSRYAQRFLSISYGSQQTVVAGLPIAACYSRDLQITSISALVRSGQNTNQVFLQPPQPLTGYFCENPNDVCWCSILSLGTQTTTGGQATVPGTTRTPHWPPDESYYVQDVPHAEPNAVDCDLKSDASIKAHIAGSDQTGSQLRIFAAGQPVTIEGEVGYFSNVCNGYQYTCEKFQELVCDYEEAKLSNFYTAKLEYKKCPSALPTRIAAEGEKKDFCLGCMFKSFINFAAIGASIALLFIPGGAAFIPLVMNAASCLTTLSPILDGKTDCVNLAAATASCGQAAAGIFGSGTSGKTSTTGGTSGPGATTVPPSTSPPDRWSWSAPEPDMQSGFGIAYAQTTGIWWYCYEKNTCASGATFSAACYGGTGGPSAGPSFSTQQECQKNIYQTSTGSGPTAQQIQQTTNALLQLQAYSQMAASCSLFTPQDASDCWSVCAKQYTTAAAASPRCNFGGPVKSYTEAQYACAARSCGSFAGHTVQVAVLYDDEVMMTDSTMTDEAGAFSYTFMAPNVDDVVKIVLATSV